MNPAVQHVLNFFHPGSGQIEQAYYELAYLIANAQPNSPETTVALRKLLESRDAVKRSFD